MRTVQSCCHKRARRALTPTDKLSVRPVTLSPVTRSPSPLPKRPRPAPQQPSAAPALHAAGAHAHALAVLARRDGVHAVHVRGHLDGMWVTPGMRGQVVRWAFDIVADLALPDGVVAIALNLFDRVLNLRALGRRLSRHGVHALSAACVWIGCKIVADDAVGMHAIANGAAVRVVHMLKMEAVVLGALEWRVCVVTPHEVVACLEVELRVGDLVDGGQQLDGLHEALLQHVIMDYALAWMRATCVGLACVVVARAARRGIAYVRQGVFADCEVYRLGVCCGVDMAQVDECIGHLVGVSAALVERGFEDVHVHVDRDGGAHEDEDEECD